MDTATQALLGATVGQACFSHQLGRRALVWGAVGGLIPDLDVLAVATHGPFGEFLYHRGPTHGLWFGPVVGPALGYAVWRFYARRRRAGEDRRETSDAARAALPDPGERVLRPLWMWLFVLTLFTHPLLDVFTSYGTQLLAPFSRERFSLHGVGIIDPFYSSLLILALFVGSSARASSALRRGVAAAALTLTTAYLFYGVHLNGQAEADIRHALAAEGIRDARVRVYPTILQPYLRRVVARTAEEVRVGLYTPWRPGQPAWESFRPPPPHPLIEKLLGTREGAIFVWFAMGEVAPRVMQSQSGVIVEIDDLRYGFPGAPDQGMWGVRAFFDGEGRLHGPVRRFERRGPELARPTLRALWDATWGDFSGLATRS